MVSKTNKPSTLRPKVYIVLVNYNNFRDTIECIESLLHLDYENFHIVLVENGSTNNSEMMFKEWLNGKFSIWMPSQNPLRKFVFPLAKKPLSFSEYILNKGDFSSTSKVVNAKISLVKIKDNKGFAKGNNTGILFALSQNDMEYVWCLNNDTVVDFQALTQLIKTTANKPGLGILGSKLRYYHSPQILQAMGGRLNKWLGTTSHIGNFKIDTHQYDNKPLKFDYIVGAAMLMNKSFLADTGLMDESYYLTYDDVDWSLRAKRRGWALSCSPLSIVYHKEGGCIGSSSKGKMKSESSDLWGLRNRIALMKKLFPKRIWSVYLGFSITIFNRARRKQFKRISKIIKLMFKHRDLKRS